MRHSMQNAILTKLSMWEYGNRGCPIFTMKSGWVSRLVYYGALIGFRVCVYGMFRHARTMTSWGPSKHQACWCVLHTYQCHLVTWIKTITLQWSCTQCSMNTYLRLSPWAHIHTTRSRALMTREGYSRSHGSLSYKVHNHPHTPGHKYIYIYIYIHTFIMYNAITQSRKVKKTLPTFQGYGPARYRKCKTYIAIPTECGPSKEQEK